MQLTSQRPYYLEDQDRLRALPVVRSERARELDTNGDFILQDSELLEAIEHEDVCHGPHHHHHRGGDETQLLEQFKHHMLARPNPDAAAYHSYDQAAARLGDLEQRFPDRCQKVSLGKTAEGRDIWALRISDNVHSEETSKKPGVVITGCHHAREWMSVEIPLHVAGELVEKADSDPSIKKRLEGAEIFVVPIVNPDGYEYSRTTDNWWRKNRNPVTVDANGKPTKATGVDLNRNYWDGKAEHFELYRPKGDTSTSTSDDFSSTSDRPTADTYRGPKGGSEVEVQSLLNLELNHKNIRGVIDHHSYSEMILYPWGHTRKPSEKDATYREIGTKLNNALGGDYDLSQSSGLYPASGESDDCHHANGILSFTFEVGRSFQPSPSEIQPMCEKVGKANMAFIDEIIERAKTGRLPERAEL